MKSWTVDDVMTTGVISVDAAASYRQMVDLMIGHRVSALPVVDAFGLVIGVVSEADLLRKIEYGGDEEPRLFESHRRRTERGKAWADTAVDLMSTPPVVVPLGTSIAAVARLLGEKHVKRTPVVDSAGHLAGIVSRSDLLKVHLRSDEELLADIETGLLRPFFADDAGEIAVAVQDGAVDLAGRTGRWSDAALAVRLIRQVPGVVGVVSRVEYDFDDRDQPSPSRLYGVPKRPG